MVCDESVLPPSAVTRLLKLVCRSLNAEPEVADVGDATEVADVAAVELSVAELLDEVPLDEDWLGSDAASCSMSLCSPPPP